MRRQDRHIRNGAFITAACAVGIDIIRQADEKEKLGAKLTCENFDVMRGLRTGLLSGIAGGFAGYIYYHYSIFQEEKHPFSPDEFLNKILNSERIRTNTLSFQFLLRKRNNIKKFLESAYGNRLAHHPRDVGSFARRTNISTNYDIDIMAIFKSEAFSTLEEMSEDVYEKLFKKFSHTAIVSKHTKSVNLCFSFEGLEISFDVVPARLTHPGSKTSNLYIRPPWFWQRGKSFKTSPFIHRNLTSYFPEARKVIRLLKIYRDRNHLSLPGIIIEHAVVKAMSDNVFGTYNSITENLLNSMDFLASKLMHNSFKDLANGNNNLNAKLGNCERSALADLLQRDISKIETRPNYLKEIFITN